MSPSASARHGRTPLPSHWKVAGVLPARAPFRRCIMMVHHFMMLAHHLHLLMIHHFDS